MFDIIVNPTSGKGKGAKALDKITALLDKEGIEYKVHKTQHAAHATQIVKELNDSQDHTNLMILGGDGSFNEVLNGVTDFSKITISFIPCGTGNDFAAAAKISTDPEKAILSAIKGEKRYIDFIQIGERRALNAAGAGLDVDVLEKYSTMKAFKGKMKYYASLLSVLCHVKFHKLRLTVDGVTTEKSVFIIAAANGNYIGGGMAISPTSVIDDGYITVVVVNEVKKRKIPGLLIKFLSGGKHIYQPCSEVYNVKECKIEILDEGCIQLDGELFKDKVLDCKIVSNQLEVFM